MQFDITQSKHDRVKVNEKNDKSFYIYDFFGRLPPFIDLFNGPTIILIFTDITFINYIMLLVDLLLSDISWEVGNIAVYFLMLTIHSV